MNKYTTATISQIRQIRNAGRLSRVAQAGLLWCCIGAGLALMAGCGAWRDYEAHDALIVTAHTLGQDDRWGEVTPLSRDILLEAPHHPIGHFLYGTSLLRIANPAIQVAELELRLALTLFTARDESAQERLLRPLESIYTPDSFVAQIYTELARLHLRIIHQAASYPVPDYILQQHMEQALHFVEAGLARDPDSLTLQMMEETILESLPDAPPSGLECDDNEAPPRLPEQSWPELRDQEPEGDDSTPPPPQRPLAHSARQLQC